MTSVRPEASLHEVIEAILDCGLRTVAVVNNEGYLVGVITEGDIIRCIARGLSLQVSAEDVMNLDPVFVVEGESRTRLVTDFLDNGTLAVPVVNTAGHFLGLLSTADEIRESLRLA